MAQDRVEITLGELVNAEATLTRMAALPVSVRMAYRLARLLQSVRKETTQFNTQRSGFIKEFGAERDVNDLEKIQGMTGTVFEVLPAKMEEFRVKMNELATIVVTIDKWLLDVNMLDEIKLSGSDIASLGPLISE